MAAPTKYKDDFPTKLVDHMSKGFSFESFAGDVGVSEETIHDWCREKDKQGNANPRFKPEFSESKKEGLAKSKIFWERIGVNAALGLPMKYKDEKGKEQTTSNYNATVWIFNMKNRFGWRDRTDHTSGDEPLDNTAHIALKEIAEALKNANRNSEPNDPTGSVEQSAIPEGTSPSPS